MDLNFEKVFNAYEEGHFEYGLLPKYSFRLAKEVIPEQVFIRIYFKKTFFGSVSEKTYFEIVNSFVETDNGLNIYPKCSIKIEHKKSTIFEYEYQSLEENSFRFIVKDVIEDILDRKKTSALAKEKRKLETARKLLSE